MKTLILGIGNEIKRDDAVGLIAAREISKKIDLDVEAASAGGLSLLSKIEGYDKVFIIDSIRTKEGKPGDWYLLLVDDLQASDKNVKASHSVNLKTLKKIMAKTGEKIPEVQIFAIEVKETLEFGENLTKEVKKNLPKVISEISKAIKEILNQ